MKLYIYITDIQQYLKGEHSWCFTASATNDLENYSPYKLVGEVEVELDTNEVKLRQKAIKIIEEKEQNARAHFQITMDEFRDEKQKLLALSHDSK